MSIWPPKIIHKIFTPIYEKTLICIEMTPKAVQFCVYMTPQKYRLNLHTQKNSFFWKPPKILKFKIFNPPKNGPWNFQNTPTPWGSDPLHYYNAFLVPCCVIYRNKIKIKLSLPSGNMLCPLLFSHKTLIVGALGDFQRPKKHTRQVLSKYSGCPVSKDNYQVFWKLFGLPFFKQQSRGMKI